MYDLLLGEDDARVCKDIPDAACADQPRNFFAYLFANLFNKIADDLVSARLTLPWLFTALGAPAGLVALLVPLRESGVLLPQLIVAASVRAMARRKLVWLAGAMLSALILILMWLVSMLTTGALAGWLLLLCVLFYSLARGLCSVSAKDVLGKTVSKTRRGRLMGYSTSLAGLATLLIGLLLQADVVAVQGKSVLLVFLFAAAVCWMVSLLSFMQIVEPAGATEGGGNALEHALGSLRILFDDGSFRQYVISRVLLLSTALVVPFYVILMQGIFRDELSILGWLIIINGLAGSLSAPRVGRLADSSSRSVMAGAALLAGASGLLLYGLVVAGLHEQLHGAPLFLLFFLVVLAHGAVRLGRKVYLVDLANAENRVTYVAVSNTVVGIAMLLGGMIGILAELFLVHTVILLLSVLSLIACVYIRVLPEVSG